MRSCTPSAACARHWGSEMAVLAWSEERIDLLAHRRERRRAHARRLATGAAGLLGLLIAWQLAALALDDRVILPSATQTAHSFAHYLTHPYPAHSLPLWRDL